jgi:hypothetical protein
MNYTLGQLQNRINLMVELQGENAPCAAWIYTAEDCTIRDEDGEVSEYPCDKNPFLAKLIMEDVGNIDYIYQVIQECVDESTEEHVVQYQQELVEVE